MSLYRKHRPQQFADLVGQDHIKTTLANALKSGKFSHAYIFAGPKGSGKTTTARILAKALNCSGRDIAKEVEPCDKCMSCLEVTGGHSMDVVEIDAASNRGIDEIRDLREKIKFAPTAGRYKVYVIDECHMLTKEAFNALLKTLEEPPKHAIFVLATTELHKVPATILSRAQLFDFKKAKIDEIVGLLNEIAKREQIQIEPEAVQLVARLAYGAYRDALTLLDQVSSVRSDSKSITLAETQLVLGQATEQSVWDFVQALLAKDRSRALEIISEVSFEGKDLSNFSSEVIELLRKVILSQVGLDTQFEATKEEKEKITDFARSIDDKALAQLIQKMVYILPQVKASVLGQLPLEMLVVEFVSSGNERQIENENLKVQNDNVKLKIEKETKSEIPKLEPIIEKPSNIEKEKADQPKQAVILSPKDAAVNQGSIEQPMIDPSPTAQDDNIKSAILSSEDAESEKETKIEVATVKSDGPLVSSWSEVVKILRKHNHAIAAMLRDAAVREETEDTLTLGVKFKFQADQLCNVKIRPLIEEAVKEVSGKTLKLECLVDSDIKIEKPVEREEVLLADAKDIFESE